MFGLSASLHRALTDGLSRAFLDEPLCLVEHVRSPAAPRTRASNRRKIRDWSFHPASCGQPTAVPAATRLIATLPRDKAREERRRSLIPAPAFPPSKNEALTPGPVRNRKQLREKTAGIIARADTSRHKAVKRRLERAVAARDAILSELYHRIGNHLQLISTMMRLEAHDCASVDAAVDKMEQRLIALHHAYTALEGQPGPVPAGAFLDAVCEPLKSDRVNVELSFAREAQVSAESAAVVGIIVNEAVCNALKYAFTEEQRGTIAISLVQNEGQTVLRISDNGRGIDPGACAQGRGHELLRELAQSVGGDIDVESVAGSGTSIIARFPADA